MRKSDIAKINNRVGVKLDVVIIYPPVSCSTYVTSASAATFVRLRRCVAIVIDVRGSGCRDRCE